MWLRPLFILAIVLACSDNVHKSDALELGLSDGVEDSLISVLSSQPEEGLLFARQSFSVATKSHSEKEKARACIMLGMALKENGFLDSALHYYSAALDMDVLEDDKVLLSSVHNNRSLVLKNLGLYKSALIGFSQSLRMRREMFDTLGMARCMNNLSIVYKKTGLLDSALFFAFESLRLKEKIGDKTQVGNSWSNIGSIQLLLDSGQASLRSYRNAARCFHSQGHTVSLAITMLNIGDAYVNMTSAPYSYDSSKYYHDLAFKKFESVGAHQYFGMVMDAKGNALLGANRIAEAKRLFHRSLEFSVEINDVEGVIISSIHLFQCLIKQNNLDSAALVLNKASLLSKSNELMTYELEVYEFLKEMYRSSGRYDSAFFYSDKLNLLETKMREEQSALSTRITQTKYQTEKHKSEKLQAQQAQKEEETKNQRLMIAAISLGALLIISVLIATLFKQRLNAKGQLALKNEELHRKELDELVKEKELERVTALMEGQEKERARIARELHDGLGSLLATVKHHYQTVEDKMDEGKEQFESANKLLDDACVEVRRISHDMASNVLSKFGLIAALQDYAETISASGAIKLSLKVSGVNNRLDNSAEIHIFRMVQELVNNILKHAKATAAHVQLTAHQNSLNIIVEDNGRGFDENKGKEGDGMGLSNLRARVAHLNGSLDIDTQPGRGTTVVIDVPTISA